MPTSAQKCTLASLAAILLATVAVSSTIRARLKPDASAVTAASAPEDHRTTSHGQLNHEREISGTFSIVAIEPDSGICGAAVASRYPAVGSVVPYARGGIGAFCTQHYHNPAWGPRALELLAAGKPADEVLAALLHDDPRPLTRQLAIVDRQGRTAQHNPTQAPEGSRWWGSAAGRFYACQGNTLAGREVIRAMADTYETVDGSLADRLMAALVAGDCAGGDHRGRLAAGIVVGKPELQGDWLRLAVDASDNAVLELARKYQELEHDAKGTGSSSKPSADPCAQVPSLKTPQSTQP